MKRRGVLVAAAAVCALAGCDKKKEDDGKGSTNDPWASSGTAVKLADDPWDPKPKNADAPPPPLASKMGARAGDQLARLAEAAPEAAPAPTTVAAPAVTAESVPRDGIPTQAMRGFAGISQTGFRVSYAASTNATHDNFRKVFEEHKVFELVAQGLNQTIRMPRTVDIQMIDCGAINAFYDPNHSRIIMCYELLTYFVGIFKGNVTSDEQLGQAVIGATLFGFYHELGHALIHQLDLPAMGREEDTADQIATLMLMEAGDDGVGMALSGAYWFHLQQKSGGNQTPFWDEHAFDGQRYYNILCMIYGSNPAKYGGFVESGNLPRTRAGRCQEEFVKIKASFQKLITPHLTLKKPSEIEYERPVGAPATEPTEPVADETDVFEAPEEPDQPEREHAVSCVQVAEKAIELIGVEAEQQLGKLPADQQEQALAEIKANLPAFLEQFLSQCAKEDWPDRDRQCVLDAATLDQAGRCGLR
jgi:hypothetical protein